MTIWTDWSYLAIRHPCTVCVMNVQIGRSTESPIDFVVTDTSGGAKDGEDPSIAPSTISRFACRIVCERNPPYTARIYAAGFDSSKNIFLGVSRNHVRPASSNVVWGNKTKRRWSHLSSICCCHHRRKLPSGKTLTGTWTA